jgi:uncharacterized protein YcbX
LVWKYTIWQPCCRCVLPTSDFSTKKTEIIKKCQA